MADKSLTPSCPIDGQSTPNADPVSIPSAETVGVLKDLTKHKRSPKFDDVAADKLTLRRVLTKDDDNDDATIALDSVPEPEKKKLRATSKLSDVFEETPPKKTIHTIVQRPPQGSYMHLSLLEPLPRSLIISRLSFVLAYHSLLRVLGSWTSSKKYKDPLIPTTGGTAGIGKTRYGRELYHALRHELSPAVKVKGLNYSPYYHYMLLDFSSDVRLGLTEDTLWAETILGLRLAYAHFFQGKYYHGFPDFLYQTKDHNGLFTISNVINAIRQDLKLPLEKPLFLFLHIDGFHRILTHRSWGTHDTTEGLHVFQDMMRSLGPYMGGSISPNMVQTFLSGTTRKYVSLDPFSYSFKFLSCPPLPIGACYDIMSHFTTLANVRHCEWMPKMAFFHLLSATGGLPRALQLLLEEFFGRQLEKCATFPDTLLNIDMTADRIFSRVASNLDSCYYISTFVQTHQELVPALVRLCIFQQSSPRTLAPSDRFPELTLEVLERRTHVILEDINEPNGKVLVRIPFFFLHLYNIASIEVRNRLGSAFFYEWMEDWKWRSFEHILAEYEALRTNLLIADGREAATLGEIYQGAVGRAETLGLIVKLKKLSVITAAHRLPESGRLMVGKQEQDWRSGILTIGNREQDWRSSIVIKNADGTQFGDVCVYREKADGNDEDIICALQTRKLESEISAAAIQSDHDKNTRAIEMIPDGSVLEQERIKRARTITILITTADITDDTFQKLNESIPNDCLLIYRRNFTKFFGDAFSMSATLAASKDLNWNFATRETLEKKHKVGDKEVDQFVENMPYRSFDDLIHKVPSMGSKKLDKEMGFLPYQGI
ncbi:hypothetical protein EC957_008401 [Mortierella hygrophila]|uniref:Crinkler effector protein N-terminal domain-containing protein n=1 Tax=Mortierella hygrophila TaxID=979708 RepID=A0A9P6JY41_9FUNG|nr:hypothetical protein EC957_008401 [Mortierella hygrophila]